MSCQTEDKIAMLQCFRTPEEKYRCCGLLNVIEHIDIYGKIKRVYNEPKNRTRRNDVNCSVTSISSSPTKIDMEKEPPGANIDSKLSRLSITTKVSGLYPGYDIMSKRARKNKRNANAVQQICNVYIPR